MRKILILAVLLLVVLVAGCVGQSPTTLESDEEAGEALNEISDELSDALGDLSDLDESVSE